MKLSDFKSSFLAPIKPPKKEIFEVLHPEGTKYLFQLRVGLSPLKAHKNAHNFQDTPSAISHCGNGPEDTPHFLLKCPFFQIKRTKFLANLETICNNFLAMSTHDQVHCLLYGFTGLNDTQNALLLYETITFICESGRFNRVTNE